jgi:basic amino acid/polyamine antiporter, APA family
LFRDLFHVKDLKDILAAAEDPKAGLKRVLGPLQITLLGVGAIIGAGIFSSIGTAAAGSADRVGAGPSLILSFVVTALVCALTAFCYAEFASRVPIAGSAYTYAYATLGEVIAWIIGWDLIIEYAIGNVAVAISWSGYFRDVLDKLGIPFPLWLATDYSSATPELLAAAPHFLGMPIVFNLLAFGIVMALTLVLVRGVNESARFNAIMVVIKVLVLLLFVATAVAYVAPSQMAANWQPFMPNGFKGMITGAAMVFFSYIGFDAVSTLAEETRNPKRDLPIGIFASLGLCTLLYVVVSAAFLGLVPYSKLTQLLGNEKADPLTMALDSVASGSVGTAASFIVAIGAVVSMTAVLLVFQLGQPRIFFSMARDGLLSPTFAKVHPRYRTPHITTIATGFVVATLAGFSNIDKMIDLTNIGTLFAFVLVCLGIPLLRLQDRRLGTVPAADGFRVPFGPFLLPILGAVSCVGLMVYLPPTSWWRFASWLVLGMAVYSGYGYCHSTVGSKLGRPSRTPAALHVAAGAFTLAAIGLFVMPHDQPVLTLLQEMLTPSETPKAAFGMWSTVLGLGVAVACWLAVLGRGRRA